MKRERISTKGSNRSRSSRQVERRVRPLATQGQIDELKARRFALREQAEQIEKQITELERDGRLDELRSYIGKYFEHQFSPGNSHYIYVTGVDEEYLRNRVIEVGAIYGDGEPWLILETSSTIYDMKEMLPSTKEAFENVLLLVKKVMEQAA